MRVVQELQREAASPPVGTSQSLTGSNSRLDAPALALHYGENA